MAAANYREEFSFKSQKDKLSMRLMSIKYPNKYKMRAG